jgi:hypothetical protein
MPPPKKPTRPNLTLVRNPPNDSGAPSRARRELDAFKPLDLAHRGRASHAKAMLEDALTIAVSTPTSECSTVAQP